MTIRKPIMSRAEMEISNYNTDFHNWFPALDEFFKLEKEKPSNFTEIKVTPTKTYKFPMEVACGFIDYYKKGEIKWFVALWHKIADMPEHPLTQQINSIVDLMTEYKADGDDFMFMRTGWYSFKHYWKDMCKIDLTDEDMFYPPNILWRMAMMMTQIMMGPGNGLFLCHTIIVRKQIQTNPLFTAFEGEFPLNPEIRLFVDAERGLYHYQPYWLPHTILKPSIDNWEEVLNESNAKHINEDNITQLADRAIRLMRHFDPEWQNKEETIAKAEVKKKQAVEGFREMNKKAGIVDVAKDMINGILKGDENVLDNPLAKQLMEMPLDVHKKQVDNIIGVGLVPHSDYSVDFLLGADGHWYVIDIAPGEVSHQYEEFEPDEALMKRINREYLDE